VEDVETCIRMVQEAGTDNVFSVTQSRRNPYFNMVEVVDGRVKLVKSLDRPVVGRQSAPPVYDMNASIYAWKRAALMDNDTIFLAGTRIYEMSEWALDIDNELDFEFAEFILSKRGNK
jgi:CMP-N-acetylneuraminic acid synthetase